MTPLSETYRELQSSGSPTCPGSDALASVAIGEASSEERDRVADHAIACRGCSEDLQILMRTHAEASAALFRRSPARWAWISAAAAVVIAAGAVLFLRSERPHDVLRGGRLNETAAVAPADGRTLTAPPKQLRWPALPGAEGYRAKLYDASGEAIWESERVVQPSADLPSSAASRLRAGASYFWVVEAELPLEKQRLGPYRFVLTGK